MKYFLILIIAFSLINFCNAQWTQIGNDIDGEAHGDNSGSAIAINDAGNIIAIGAYNNDGNGWIKGHVRVFEFQGNNWSQMGLDLDGDSCNSDFGWSVSLNSNGDILAVSDDYYMPFFPNLILKYGNV